MGLPNGSASFPTRESRYQETSATMKSLVLRLIAAAIAVGLAASMLGAASPGKIREPDKLIILSTSDVKGKNEPCG